VRKSQFHTLVSGILFRARLSHAKCSNDLMKSIGSAVDRRRDAGESCCFGLDVPLPPTTSFLSKLLSTSFLSKLLSTFFLSKLLSDRGEGNPSGKKGTSSADQATSKGLVRSQRAAEPLW
jgi:hypothetical protein